VLINEVILVIVEGGDEVDDDVDKEAYVDDRINSYHGPVVVLTEG
jgi:hypothetical protein